MKKLFAAVTLSIALGTHASAQVLTFEGIGNNQLVGNYYNGGAGPNYGIDFFGTAYAKESSVNNCQGTGNFAQQPSGCAALFFADNQPTGINLAAGFTTGVSLFYSMVNNPGSLAVWSGLNGTGSLLASLALPKTTDGSLTPGCGGKDYCPFPAIGVGFAGIARSIVLVGDPAASLFDDVTFGSVTPGTVTPEPSTYLLVAAGLFGIGMVRRRRARQTQA